MKKKRSPTSNEIPKFIEKPQTLIFGLQEKEEPMKVRARELAIAQNSKKISDIEFQEMDLKQRSTTQQMIVSILEC
jgi:hypothetical protein